MFFLFDILVQNYFSRVCKGTLMCTNKYLYGCYFQVLIMQKVTTAFFIEEKRNQNDCSNVGLSVSG